MHLGEKRRNTDICFTLPEVHGMMFHTVAAALLRHLLPYVTPCVCGTVSRASDSELRDLVG